MSNRIERRRIAWFGSAGGICKQNEADSRLGHWRDCAELPVEINGNFVPRRSINTFLFVPLLRRGMYGDTYCTARLGEQDDRSAVHISSFCHRV